MLFFSFFPTTHSLLKWSVANRFLFLLCCLVCTRPTNEKKSGTATQRGATDQLINAARNQQRQDQQQGSNVSGDIGRITVFRNGILLGDDDPSNFRDIADPSTKQFIDELIAGNVPRELQRECFEKWGPGVEQVGVQLVNRQKEDYVPPKPTFQAFSTPGQTLGSGGSSSSNTSTFANATPRELVADQGKPTGAIQLVLPDRRKVRLTCNPEVHTVLDVYRHVLTLVGGGGPCEMRAGFPPRPLKDARATVKAAGLSGSQIQIKK